MKATIIIPVKDDARIRRCVESVLNQTVSRENYEVIVVDNNSTKINIWPLLNDLPIKFYTEKRAGIAAAVNRGLLHACGDYLVRIDADCIAEKNWLEELLLPFSMPKIGAVGGVILKESGKSFVEIASRGLVIGDQFEPQYLPMFHAPYIVTANAAYRLDVIKQIGGFDEAFISGSDVDISWRIQLAGYEVCTTPTSVVYHPSRPTVRKHFYQFYNYGVGHALLCKKYKEVTGKKALVNIYPFIGILRLFSQDIPKAFLYLIVKKKGLKVYLIRIILDLTEYLALICGDIVGAVRYRILYF